MNIMNTYTGKQFDPMHICADNICIEDIAHALSLLCRGGGQHSVNCAREAAARGWNNRMALACLLHDASEAYISDIIRPVKIYLNNYLEIENMIMNVIWKKYDLYNLSEEENRMWKLIDNEMLDNELKILLPGEKSRVPASLSSTPDFRERPHSEIEQEFLTFFHTLTMHTS